MNKFETFEDALENIGRFIEDGDTSKRMHSSRGYMSLIEYDQEKDNLFSVV